MKCPQCNSDLGHKFDCPLKFGFPRPAPKPSSTKKVKGRKNKDDRKGN